MKIKDDFLSLKKDDHQFFVKSNNFCNNKDTQKYSNLNLNQICKNSDSSSVQFQSKSICNEKFDFDSSKICFFVISLILVIVFYVRNIKVCQWTAAIHKVIDPTISHTYGNNNKSLNKSFINNLRPSISESFNDLKSKNQWKKNDISFSNSNAKNNNSTLSLHISAYENLNKTNSFGDDENKINEINGTNPKNSIKKWKNAKQCFNNLTSVVQSSFEYPRQQEENFMNPEIMQFKASQQLFNPSNNPTSNLPSFGEVLNDMTTFYQLLLTFYVITALLSLKIILCAKPLKKKSQKEPPKTTATLPSSAIVSDSTANPATDSAATNQQNPNAPKKVQFLSDNDPKGDSLYNIKTDMAFPKKNA